MSLRKLAPAVTARVIMMAFVSLLIFSVTLPNTAYCQPPPPPPRPYVYVLVWDVYPNVQDAIATYKQDLENDGFSVEIKFWPHLGNTPEVIRELLQTEAETHEIAGVLLVGDVPYAKYEIVDGYGYYYDFPCDLYYMDLDGNWTDSGSWILDGAKAVNWTYNPNEIYDMHTDGAGDLEPEIWVGRLYASTLKNLFGSTEVQLLNNYFDKNHRYRTGELTLPRRGLAYLDDDFATGWWGPPNSEPIVDSVNRSLHMIYENETILVTDPDTTSAADYKNRLNDTLCYEWLILGAHSNPTSHAFKAAGNVESSDIRDIDPHAFFYNLIACSVTRYTYQDYIGGAYVFADTYGLLAIGSTTPGSMTHESDFYGPLAQGKCVGQAFKEWLEKYVGIYPSSYHGMTILGDPILRTPRYYNLTVLAEDQYGNSLTTGDVYIDGEWCGLTGSTFMVTMGNRMVFVNDFWEAGRTGYRYFFDHWEDDSTENPRNVMVAKETTVKVYFCKKWCPGDVNGDGVVDSADVDLIRAALFSQRGDPNWDSRCDLNCDGRVNGADMIIYGKYIGNTYPDYLTVLAKDLDDNPLTTGDVYIDDEWCGLTNSTFTVTTGTHTVFVNDFWEAGRTGYRYCFRHWEDDSTSPTRNVKVVGDTAVTAYFCKKWCPGDVNGDGVVDSADVDLIRAALFSQRGDPNWDSRCDLNCDGRVNGADMIIYGKYIGNTYPEPLTVLAEENGTSLTTVDVYIDGEWCGLTGSTFMVTMGNRMVFVNDFWEAGRTGYRYFFDHWEDDSTENPRNVMVAKETTVKVYFCKKWCPGDVNGDGTVDANDQTLILEALFSQRGDPNWDSRCDLNCDGRVDSADYLDNLTVLAEENGTSLTTVDVYIDGEWCGLTGSTFFMVTMGNRMVFVNDFWEAELTGYRYGFKNWTDGSVDNPRNVTVDGDTTIKVYFCKKWCPGDVNGDGTVDSADLDLILEALFSQRGDPNWDSRCDLNCDGRVDGGDKIIYWIYVGNTYPDP